MTEQYGQPNINNPRLVRSFVATVAPLLVQLNYDDGLVVVDSTAGTIGFTLPLASQFPGWQVILKATNAGSSGNSVFVGTIVGSGETIDGAAFVMLTSDQEALFLKSDGSDWRVVAGAGSGGGAGISLDITYDSTASGSVAPILFVTWPEVLAAVAAIPGNAGALYMKTKYRLNVQTLSTIDPGLYSLTNAEFRSAVKASPNGSGASLFGSGSFLIEDVAQINGIGIAGISFGPTFSWPNLNFVEIIDSVFIQTLNGQAAPILIFPRSFTVMRCYGSSSFGFGSITAGSAPGDTLVIDAYDRVAMTSGSLAGPGDVDINILSGGCDISLAQTSFSGTLNLNIGGGQTSNGEKYSLGETIFFSSGVVTFANTAEREIYAGGTNPPGAAPQLPALVVPSRGYIAPKDGYLRGIGVRIPTVYAPSVAITVRVYVAGVLVLTEPFVTGTDSQFSAATFGAYNEGDAIQVTVAADLASEPAPTLADGIVISLRSA